MKITLTLEAKGEEFEVPINYNSFIQAALYGLLPPDFATFLHDEGFAYEKRAFRFFSFSRLMGGYKFNRNNGTIRFTNTVRLVISSPLSVFCEAILDALLQHRVFRIGAAELHIAKVESSWHEVTSSSILVRTLSPVTVYSTLYRGDGRKYTLYFHPREATFAELVRENLRKKYLTALRDPNVPIHLQDTDFDFSIQVIGRAKKSLVNYKSTNIQGYMATFRLEGPPQILQLALDASLGNKNSQGFGCIELVEEQSQKGGGNFAYRESH